MTHNRKLAIGGIALTMAKIPSKINASATNRVRDEIEREIIQSGYLNAAPFSWVSLLIRKGLVDEAEPHYERINSKHGDLPLAIEIDAHRLLEASEDDMVSIYRKATLTALVHAGEKYQLPVDRLRALLKAAA